MKRTEQERKDRVCPVALHRSLSNPFRKLIHNPKKILSQYIKEGDTAIDIGCGPGFFTIPMAELTGKKGRTIAADLQQGMLDIVKKKIKNKPAAKNIILHRTTETSLNLAIRADFALLFYMVHEVPNREELFHQVRATMKPTGTVLVIEPPVHVTKKHFEETKQAAQRAGFKVEKGPMLFLDRTAILRPVKEAQ